MWSFNTGGVFKLYKMHYTMGTGNEDPLTQAFAQYRWSCKAGLTVYPYTCSITYHFSNKAIQNVCYADLNCGCYNMIHCIKVRNTSTSVISSYYISPSLVRSLPSKDTQIIR